MMMRNPLLGALTGRLSLSGGGLRNARSDVTPMGTRARSSQLLLDAAATSVACGWGSEPSVADVGRERPAVRQRETGVEEHSRACRPGAAHAWSSRSSP